MRALPGNSRTGSTKKHGRKKTGSRVDWEETDTTGEKREEKEKIIISTQGWET